MITGISIENFKGIRDRVDLQLRPITLLFGANSAGKSTILHALQYGAEVFERRNLDAGVIGDGAAGIDLGGFHRFVHGHNANQDVTLGFTLELGDFPAFPTYGSRPLRDVDEPSSLYSPPRTGSVSVAIGWSDLLRRPFVRQYSVQLDETALAEIYFEPGAMDCTLLLNEQHPTFVTGGSHSALRLWSPVDHDEDAGEQTVLSWLIHWALHTGAILGIGPAESPYTAMFGLFSQNDALPDFVRPLSFDADWDSVDADPQLQSARIPELSEYLIDAVSQLVLGPGRLLRDELAKLRFLGPIREIPRRNRTATLQPERSRWASGLGAWERLEADDGEFIESVSHWLGDESRLNSGYRINQKHFKELDLSDPLVIKLLTGRAFDEADPDSRLDLDRLPTRSRVLIVPANGSLELGPSDVGIGISQVVPVIVVALDGTGRTIAVEQPELHLHPKLQAELGDLFIEAALGGRRHRFLLETHSEHLILRLLRRIRETTAGKNADSPAITTEDLMVLYVHAEDGQSRFMELRTDKHGRLIDACPEGFFEEDFAELF